MMKSGDVMRHIVSWVVIKPNGDCRNQAIQLNDITNSAPAETFF